ncbi:ZIP family metal transporter [Leeuwenhoekiella marinoflava]|uniref:Zinc transporter ZupT n=2 Tax=Leeuwenhoekiella marinoflava TaxID=988 RepID=A0A4Q0P3M5_9FLAO|nr:ZIP family metal transporter [Leeuwenhoekiella marinoflava]RXG20648.1 zinc transporter ZupT [Leeuwenhoekiella marinoflava]SHG06852.1 Zinc transporter ZupT [Leeuwenhoekiella marinoflava DSM 3653]
MIFILPIAAVLLGFLIALIFKPTFNNTVKLLLSFSGAFLLSITIFEFLPELYASGSKEIGLYIMGGLLLQILLEFLSRGAEHGHLHLDSKTKNIPWLLFISLAVHSIFEGFPLSQNEDLVYGIIIHKIPIAIIISSFLIVSNISKIQILIFLILFALMTPIGSYLGALDFWTESLKNNINAIVVGVLLHVSTTILFESSKNHQFNATKFGTILLGIGLAYIL